MGAEKERKEEMNVTGDTKIYRKDFNGRPSYSRCIASQEYNNGQKGDWIRTYESVQFPKGTDIPDRSIVRIKGFEATYNSKNGVQRKLVVQEYKVMEYPTQYKNDGSPLDGFSSVDEEMPF